MIPMGIGHIVFFTLFISQTCRSFFSPMAILIEAWGIAPENRDVLISVVGWFLMRRFPGEMPLAMVILAVGQMEDNGLEPMTFCMPCKRSPN